jgi:HB1, ASXL, restriction endonuclease HTH domain
MTAKKTTKTQPTNAAEKAPKAAKQKAKPKKLSALDAAAKLLGETGQPMNCQEMIEAMAKKGLWTSPGGKTPHATLYSAILRELKAKGKDARFKKTERGKFAAA